MKVEGGLCWEVLIVDNNSSDNTRIMVRAMCLGSLGNGRYIFEGKQGLSHARNRGVQEARGEIISFLDDDVVVDKGWLVSVVAGFEQYDPMILGGRVLIDGNVQLPRWLSARHQGPLGGFDMGPIPIIAGTAGGGGVGIGANMSFNRKVFDQYGLFDLRLGRVGSKLGMGEETDLYRRVKGRGERCVYYPDAVVYQVPLPERLKKSYFRRWYFRMGEWNAFTDQVNGGWSEPIRLFGVPRWMYRKAAADLLACAKAVLKGELAEIEARKLDVMMFLGYFMYAQRTRRMFA